MKKKCGIYKASQAETIIIFINMAKLIGNFESIFRGIAALTFHHLFMTWLLIDIFTRKIYYRLFPWILRGRKMEPWKRVVQWHSGMLLDIIGVKVIKEYEVIKQKNYF